MKKSFISRTFDVTWRFILGVIVGPMIIVLNIHIFNLDRAYIGLKFPSLDASDTGIAAALSMLIGYCISSFLIADYYDKEMEKEGKTGVEAF